MYSLSEIQTLSAYPKDIDNSSVCLHNWFSESIPQPNKNGYWDLDYVLLIEPVWNRNGLIDWILGFRLFFVGAISESRLYV